LLWRQQRPDLFDGGLSIWLETCPDLLQLAARGLNLCRVPSIGGLADSTRGRRQSGVGGCLILLACLGEVVLDQLQLGSLLCGELQLFLETGRQEASFRLKSGPFSNATLVFHGLGEGEGIGVGCFAPANAGVASTSELLITSKLSFIFIRFPL